MDSVAELLRQFAFLGTVLAGFAVTFLVALIGLPDKRRSVDGTAIAALVAACLIVCAIAGAAGIIYIVDHPRLHAIQP